jgi:hypothetical protein
MPSRLLACPACARHVRVLETVCPFCAAELPATFGDGPLPAPPPKGLSRSAVYRHGVLAAAGAVAGTAAIGLGGGGVLASACTNSISQPDDAGTFVEYEGGHPTATMYGSPCELTDDPPVRCCGEVTKEILGVRCLGCTGGVAYALCVGGAFTCACTCERPVGYTLVGPDGGEMECGAGEMDTGLGDAAAETDAPNDAAADAEGGANVDAHEGG